MRRAAALLVFVSVLALAATTGAGARPPFNPVCDGTKIDPVSSGTYDLVSGGTVTVTVRETDEGQVFDFDTLDPSNAIDTVTVKGGPAYLSYSESTSADSGLHAPYNSHSGYWYGLSYICFTQGGGGGVG